MVRLSSALGHGTKQHCIFGMPIVGVQQGVGMTKSAEALSAFQTCHGVVQLVAAATPQI